FGILTKDGAFLEVGEENEAVSVNWAELDYEGNIWLASSGLGLVKYTRAAFYTPNTVAGLSGKAINTIEEFDGFYYVGTDNGLYLFDAEWKQQKNKLTESLQNVRIRHIKAASDGLVYIATYYDYGLICYDPFKEGITAYSTENGLVDDGVRVILPLSDGRVAVGTQKGISILEDGKVTENYGSKE
ncbi:MAG: hypothetical protein IJ336_07140, partial [Lachnospiraceae bacterium]|nr:hypothetical protein [Lachnospiraceae bacterium]